MPPRRRVVICTAHWGEDGDEQTIVTRLVAGALSRTVDVEIVHLCSPPGPRADFADSVFTVHQVPVHGARPLRASIMRAALARHDDGRRIPDAADAVLRSYEGTAPDVSVLIADIDPAVVVVCGAELPLTPDELIGTRRTRRLVVIPLLNDLVRLGDPAVRRLLGAADLVATGHPGETRAARAALAGGTTSVVPLELGLTINRSATTHGLFGVRFFLPYVLLIRSFPPEGPRFARSVTHDVICSVAGRVRRDDVDEENWRFAYDEIPDELPISVAEVDGVHWRIGDDENTLELPVNPTRVNLWRLMAHALFMIDLRPPGPLGREALESMMFGTPVIVPEGSAAMEHAAAANGGLWFRDPGELLDAVRALTHRPLREALAASARAHVGPLHGDMAAFVDRLGGLVLPRD